MENLVLYFCQIELVWPGSCHLRASSVLKAWPCCVFLDVFQDHLNGAPLCTRKFSHYDELFFPALAAAFSMCCFYFERLLKVLPK